MKNNRNSYGLRIGLTILGFALAEITSFVLPTIQEDVDDRVYRAVLAGLIIFFVASGIRAGFTPLKRARYEKRAPFRFVLGLILAAWDILSAKTGIFPLPFFPSPSKILSVFLTDRDFMIQNLFFSLKLYFSGFLSGVLMGVGTGILIGWFPKVNYWVMPVMRITGVIPAVAWIPVALTIFRSGFVTGTFLIAMCAWFPIGFQTASGMQRTEKIYFEAAKTIGGGSLYQLFNVALPNAMPAVFTGISTANGLAFTTLVISEMLGAKGGLGYYINWAKAWAEYYKVYAAIIVMAVMFSLILKGINLIKDRVLIWQKGLVNAIDES